MSFTVSNLDLGLWLSYLPPKNSLSALNNSIALLDSLTEPKDASLESSAQNAKFASLTYESCGFGSSEIVAMKSADAQMAASIHKNTQTRKTSWAILVGVTGWQPTAGPSDR